MRRIAAMVLGTALVAGTGEVKAPAITQAELLRRTQELYDAVAPGDQGPWKRYYADDCVYFDEKGRSMDKAALIADLQPLPKGYGGHIQVARAQSRIFATVAILSYDCDESETVFGQALAARYHSTDTWMLRDGEWKIVASQTLRYYEDPAMGQADPARFAAFSGTYELAPGNRRIVSAEGGRLFLQREGRAKEELLPETAELFFRKGVEGRILFRAASEGRVDALIDRRNNEDLVWKKLP
jgi:hypothetical protein